MNNYKERYSSLNKDIIRIENNKKQLEQSLIIEELKFEDKKKKEKELRNELDTLKYERSQIINKKNKITNLAINTSVVITLLGTVLLGIITYQAISPTEIVGILLTLLGVTTGATTLFCIAYTIIKTVGLKLKKKKKNQLEYKKIIREINAKNRELENINCEKKQIEKVMDKISSDINTQNDLLSSSKREVSQLFGEILTATLEEPILSKEPEISEENSKPKTRTLLK